MSSPPAAAAVELRRGSAHPADWRIGRLLPILVLAFILPSHASATDVACDCFVLTAWSSDTGLPSHNILSITQDHEGYLWLGTDGGLLRFNGLRFEPWNVSEAPLAGIHITTLVTGRDGSLWIGFNDSAGISRITKGRVVNYQQPSRSGQDGILTLLEDRSGTVWAGGRNGLTFFRDGEWHGTAEALGLPQGEITSLYQDREGNLWVGSGRGIYRRDDQDTVFKLYDAESRFVQAFAQDRDGTIWVADSQQIFRSLGKTQPVDLGTGIRLPAGGWRLLPDRNDSLWIAALGEGLMRARRSDNGRRRLERVRYEHKIARGARTLYEDRDHNIWIGLRGGGLVRVSETPVQTGIQLDGVTNDGVRALATTRDGSVWVATGRSLNQFSGDDRRTFELDRTMALHTAHDGQLWAVAGRGVGRFDESGFHPLPTPPGIRFGRIVSLTTDADRGVWLCSNEQGLLRWHSERLETFQEAPAIAGRPCSFVYADRRGRVWVGFSSDGIAVYENGGFRSYTTGEGLTRGRIAAIHEDRSGSIWISSATGLTRVRDGVLTTVTRDNGLPDGIVPSIVEDDDGHLWLGVQAGAGVIRVSPAEIERAATESGYQLDYLLYDETDGLEELLWPNLGRPTAVRGGDGRLWFMSGSGVAVIDPRFVPARQTIGQPRIDQVVANGRPVAPQPDLVLPAGTDTLQVHFSTLSLTTASKLRYRYRLDGVEQRWVYAGLGEHASYANLKPGEYRFRVGATTGGDWSENETVWAFVVPQPFYRTGAFYGIVAAFGVLMLWAAWWLRLRSVKQAYALAFDERARVSREIHDTLLQSLGGVALELEAVAKELDAALPQSGAGVRRLRRQVSHCVVEARRSISELRSPALQTHDLAEALRQMAQRASEGKALNIQVTTVGRGRRLPIHIEEQLLRIGQEAMSNAVRHAMAGNIDIVLDYRGDTVILRVSDDGCGFDVENRSHDGGEHWGLTNMRERAAKLGTTLIVRSTTGAGTVVELAAPAAGRKM